MKKEQKAAGKKSFWDKLAPIYAPAAEIMNSLYPELYAYISRYLSPDMTVLEPGCGSGQISLALHDQAYFWIGLDYSPEMIRQARKRLDKHHEHPDNLIFTAGNAMDLSYADESFDMVICVNALHAMPDAYRALCEMYRVLRPGGILIAPTLVFKNSSTPAGVKILEKFGFEARQHLQAKDLISITQKAGFEIREWFLMESFPMPECVIRARKPSKIHTGKHRR